MSHFSVDAQDKQPINLAQKSFQVQLSQFNPKIALFGAKIIKLKLK